MDDCSYCHGVRLVGWSGAGPILCPECSRGQDAFTVITQAWREQRAKVRELEDCGQNGVCALSPGCIRHWQERNREIVSQLERVLDEHAEGHWMARALDAERERDKQTLRANRSEAEHTRTWNKLQRQRENLTGLNASLNEWARRARGAEAELAKLREERRLLAKLTIANRSRRNWTSSPWAARAWEPPGEKGE